MTSKRILIGAVAALLVAVAVALALVAGASGGNASGGWGDPIELPDVRATTSTAAVTPDGVAIAAWAEETERGFTILTAERAPGGEWSDPVNVGAARPWEPRSLRLAVNHRGDTALAFLLQNRGRTVAQASFRAAGNAWEAPQTISRVSRSLLDTATAVDGTGAVTVAWTTFDSAGSTVHVARRPAGGSWNDPVRWDQTTEAWVDLPALAPSAGAATRMLALSSARRWITRRTGVALAQIGRGDRWTPLPAPPITGATGYSTSMVSTTDGGIAVAWQQDRGAGRFATRFSTLGSSGRWTAPVTLAEVSDHSGVGELRTLPAGAGAGVVWAQWTDPWLSVGVRGVLPTADGRPGATVDLGEYPVEDLRDTFVAPGGRPGPAPDPLPSPPPPQANLVVSGSGTPAALWAGGAAGRFGGELTAALAEDTNWDSTEAIPAAGRWVKPLAIGTTDDTAVAVWASHHNSTGTGTHRIMLADRQE